MSLLEEDDFESDVTPPTQNGIPSADAIPGPEEYIDRVFGPGGYMAKKFAGYEARPGQIKLSKAIDEALVFGEHLMGEGPCGTGKAQAYLVPASYHAWRNKKQVVIVTANIVLQEQLINKDLPLLKSVVPWDFSYGLLKGKNNFACISKYLDGKKNNWKDFRGSQDDYEELRSICQWIQREMDRGGTGDMSDLEFQPKLKVWKDVSVSAEECKGSDCKYYQDCFAVQSQREARKSDIIVTNYHILFSHIKLKMMTGLDMVLPEYQIAILDEAHAAPGIAREFLGMRIGKEGFIRAAKGLRGSSNQSYVERDATLLFEQIREYRKSPRYKTRIKENLLNLRGFSQAYNQLSSSCMSLIVEYDQEIGTLSKNVTDLVSRFGDSDPNTKEVRNSKASLVKKRERLNELLQQVKEMLTIERADTNVYYIDVEGQYQYTHIASKPINVGRLLSQTLYRDATSVIHTSATLSTDGNFNFIATEMGCAPFSSVIAESPFDWSRQAIMVLPDEMVPPTDPEYPQAVAENVAYVIELAKGRTLGLFTSYKVLDATWAEVKDHPKYKILKQGNGSKIKLIAEFKDNVSSVLLGTESFWTGVDISGEALSVVIIDKLPFTQPDDPVMDAIVEANPKTWFSHYAIPKAIISLKQGFGRLIRSTSDKGVVVVLDTRLRTKNYRGQFLRSLPPVKIESELATIRNFLAEPLRELTNEEFLDRALM